MLMTLTFLVLVCWSPAAARGGTGVAPDPAETRFEPSPRALTVKATGVLQRRVMIPYPSYGTHRIFDTRSMRLYALTSSRHPALLHRYAGKRVAVYGTRVLGFPRDSGVPLLDVFRVVPLAA